MTRRQAAEQQEALDQLRAIVKPGDTLCTILRHVSRSGMSRVIDVVTEDTRNIGWTVARALGDSYDQRQGIKVPGAGMDMGFHLVYSLSRALYPDGFECIGEGDGHSNYCPSNDHSNGDRDYTPHHHQDSGYAIRQRWL